MSSRGRGEKREKVLLSVNQRYIQLNTTTVYFTFGKLEFYISGQVFPSIRPFRPYNNYLCSTPGTGNTSSLQFINIELRKNT